MDMGRGVHGGTDGARASSAPERRRPRPRATSSPSCATSPPTRGSAPTAPWPGARRPWCGSTSACRRARRAASSITLTGTSLTANNGSGLTLNLSPFSPTQSVTPPAIVRYAQAPPSTPPPIPSSCSPAPTWRRRHTAARFDVTFTATVNYQAKASSGAAPVAGTATFTTLSGRPNPLKVTVEKKTNALRLLVVPMGDARPDLRQPVQRTSTRPPPRAASPPWRACCRCPTRPAT